MIAIASGNSNLHAKHGQARHLLSHGEELGEGGGHLRHQEVDGGERPS